VIGTTLKNRFQLERELGRGGMGAVYRALDTVLERPVAIKVLQEPTGEEVGRKLRLEAQILARLLHDNIVRLYDFDEDSGVFYFIMEEVDGPSYAKRWRALNRPTRLEVLAKVADALDYAHHQGIIHRDMKPGNILMTAKDQPKIADFGLSVLIGQDQETGVARGTPSHMSPEQAKGKPLDFRSDLYSFGVLLYEALTDAPPFQGNAMSLMAQHVKSEPEPPRARNSQLSAEAEQLVLRLLAKDPDARPSNAAEVAETLRLLLAEDRWHAAEASETVAMAGSTNGEATDFGPVAAAEAAAVSAAPAPRAYKRPKGLDEAERMIREVEAEPVPLSAEDRYLCGHYLGYLLGGSRREGILLRRPLDRVNADRARLLLAMAWLMDGPLTTEKLAAAVRLFENRPDVRTRLNPIHVIKYLNQRATPEKRRRFRKVRQALQQSSAYARKHMTDSRGILNPGLMPQRLEHLAKLAPERVDDVDDELVARWNRLADLWRGNAAFRQSILRYATLQSPGDPAVVQLWPEVVHPLIERARWQRRRRGRAEEFWEALAGRVLHMPLPGPRMDRMIHAQVPHREVEELDEALIAFEDDPEVIDELLDDGRSATSAGPVTMTVSRASLREITADEHVERGFIRLVDPDPERFTVGELRELFKEALEALKSRGAAQGHQPVPIGPYRLTVVASVRARKAGTIAIQGMPNKQIELHVPSFSGGGTSAKPILAVWVYENRSLVLSHLDPRGQTRYVLWDASANQQTNFDDPATLNSNLLHRSMEAPDQLSDALTKRFRPRDTV